MSKNNRILIGKPIEIGISDIDVYHTDIKKQDALKLQNSTKVRLRIGVFFDGTGNNYFNSNAVYYKQTTPINTTDLKEVKHKGFVAKHDSSYWNTYSNVKLLFDNYKEETVEPLKGSSNPHYYLQIPIYVEGIGTLRDKEDDSLGSAIGEGNRGVIARVKEACERIAISLEREFRNIKIETKLIPIIESLQFDIFGFSRGAAAARHFSNEVLKHRDSITININYKQEPLKKSKLYTQEVYGVAIDHTAVKPRRTKIFNGRKTFTGGYLGEQLRLRNIKYPLKNVSVEFMGLFDTVIAQVLEKKGVLDKARQMPDLPSFIPFPIQIAQQVLKKIKKVNPDVSSPHIKKVFHITAQDEWRKNFALTPINGTEGRKTLSVPGAHSDIGGGYWHATQERSVLHFFDVSEEHYENYILKARQLMGDLRNWYINKHYVDDSPQQIFWEEKYDVETWDIIDRSSTGVPVIRRVSRQEILVEKDFMQGRSQREVDGVLYKIKAHHFSLVSIRNLDNKLSRVYGSIMKKIAIIEGNVPFSSDAVSISNETLTTFEEYMTIIAKELWKDREERFTDPKENRYNKNGVYEYKIEQEMLHKLRKNFIHLSAKFNKTVEYMDSFYHIQDFYPYLPMLNMNNDSFIDPPYERESYTPILDKYDKN